MPKHTFEADEEWNVGMEAKTDSGYNVIAYDGNLGGGTLRVFTDIEGVKTPVANSKIAAATNDTAGDDLEQLVFISAGNIIVALSGATDPDVTVAVR